MERLPARLPSAEDIMHAGRVVLSILALASGTAALAPRTARAVPNYAAPLPAPAAAQPVKDGHHDPWVELDNAPYGYYLGEFNTTSDHAKVLAVTDQKDYAYLAVRVNRDNKTFMECGWAKTSEVAVTNNTTTASFPACNNRLDTLSYDQYAVGHYFNCEPGACNDGAQVSQTATCDGLEYRNDYAVDVATAGVSFSSTRRIKHPLYDLVGTVDASAPLYYRFTPLDNKAVEVRTNADGWVFMDADCVDGTPQGGPPNTDQQRKQHLLHGRSAVVTVTR